VASHYEYALEFHQSHTDGMMTYSSAWWDGKEMSIEEAQVNKYSRILSRIGPPPQHILDMGCGWGHFIKVAASRGYTVLTVSRRKRSATVAVGLSESGVGRVSACRPLGIYTCIGTPCARSSVRISNAARWRATKTSCFPDDLSVTITSHDASLLFRQCLMPPGGL
jgi:hypothetical protein